MSTPVFRSANAGIKRPKLGFVIAGYALWACATPILATVIWTGVFPLLTLLVHPVLFGSLALAYGHRSTRNARFDEGIVAVTHRGIELDGRLIAEREELEQGFVVPTGRWTLVKLERRGMKPAIVVRVKDEAVGAELLRALGFDAASTAAEMRIATGLAAMPVYRQLLILLPPIFAVMAGGILTGAMMPRANGPIVLGMVALLLTYVLGLAFAPTRVRIGTDGLTTRWLGRERFMPFTEIERAQRYDEIIGTKRQYGVNLFLRGGEHVRLPTGQTDIGESEAMRLVERIEEAMHARQAGSVATISDLLVRGGQTARAWVDALRRLGSGAHGLRTSAVPLDALLKVMEDAAAAPADRASAAIAAAADPSARARIRVAAETTASPRLRVALDRIADEATPDDDIAAALEELR